MRLVHNYGMNDLALLLLNLECHSAVWVVTGQGGWSWLLRVGRVELLKFSGRTMPCIISHMSNTSDEVLRFSKSELFCSTTRTWLFSILIVPLFLR